MQEDRLYPNQFLTEYFDRYRRSIFDESVKPKLIELSELIKVTQASRRKAIIAGNGGSAAVAAHCALDFSKNAGMRCIHFGEASLITCLANDFGFDRWLQKALEFYADDGDLIILISSSGKSPNMVRAADYAVSRAATLVTFTGFDPNNPLKARGKLNFWVDSKAYNIVEMTHQIWLLAAGDLIIGKAEYPASPE